MKISIGRPDSTEHAPYHEAYIKLVPGGDLLEILNRELDDSMRLMRSIPEDKGMTRYEPSKWSIKEVIGHVTDAERIFAYRALRFARNDATPLPGFEQDDYVRIAGFDRYTLEELTDEFEQVRRASLLLFRSLDNAAWMRRGIANNTEVSVRALAYILAGHARHHMEVLRARYL